MTVDRVGAMTVFVKTVESGSLSAAARALGTSLTSVSRQLSALEQSLGALLLVRTTRHLSVTDSGKFYYQHAKRILAEIEETDAALSTREDVPSGELRVSAPTLLGRLKLAPLLPLFLSKYPRLSLDLMLTDRIVHLAEEGVDLALRVGRLDDSSLVARKLGRIRSTWQVVVSRAIRTICKITTVSFSPTGAVLQNGIFKRRPGARPHALFRESARTISTRW
jgi:DNA-binding transcriptional LysR family regulator